MAAVLALDRPPEREPRPRAAVAHRADDALRPVHEPDDDRHGAVGVVRALLAEQVAPGVDRDALRLGDGLAAGFPRAVVHLEDGPDRPVGEDAPVVEVLGPVQLAVPPDGRPASAQRLADRVEVGALASVDVVGVVALLVPRLGDEVVRPLQPHVDAGRDERLELVGLPEALAVGPPRDPVALPRHVVAVVVVHRVDAGGVRLGRRGGLDADRADFLGPEADQEQQRLRRPVLV